MTDIPDTAVQAALTALVEYQRQAREPSWSIPSGEQVRAMLEGALPVLVAAERERIAALAASLDATYEERQPCSCGAKSCRGVLLRSHAPFADLIREEEGDHG